MNSTPTNPISIRQSCSCSGCVEACKKPGAFLPGQMERIAGKFRISLSQLFRETVQVGWNDVEGSRIYLPSPAVGESGWCVWFEEGVCRIHGLKPFECADYLHSDSHIDQGRRRRDVLEEWRDLQDWLKGLLGREFNPLPRRQYE